MNKFIAIALILSTAFAAIDQTGCDEWKSVWRGINSLNSEWFTNADANAQTAIGQFYKWVTEKNCADNDWLVTIDTTIQGKIKNWQNLVATTATDGKYSKVIYPTTIQYQASATEKKTIADVYSEVYAAILTLYRKDVALKRRNPYNMILANINDIATKQCMAVDTKAKSLLTWAREANSKTADGTQVLTHMKELWKQTAIVAQEQLNVFRTILTYAFFMDKDTDKFTWDTTNKVLTGINIKESTWANLAAANKALAGMKAKVDAVVLAYFKSQKASDKTCDGDAADSAFTKIKKITEDYAKAVCTNADDCTAQWDSLKLSANFVTDMGYTQAQFDSIKEMSGLTEEQVNKNQIETSERRILADTSVIKVTKKTSTEAGATQIAGEMISYVGVQADGKCIYENDCEKLTVPTSTTESTTDSAPASTTDSANILSICVLLALALFL